MMTAAERDELAVMLVPVATELAFHVHVGDADGVARTLGIVAPEHLAALCVVLAGLVDIDQDPAALLAWLAPDEPVTPEQAAQHLAVLELEVARG